MGCCIIGAILITQFLAVWRARKWRYVAGALALVGVGLLVYQYNLHAHHIHQFALDMQAIVRGEDPAVAALSQPQLRCSANDGFTAANPR